MANKEIDGEEDQRTINGKQAKVELMYTCWHLK